MNKQTLTFYVRKSNGVVTQVGHGYIWQQASGAGYASAEASLKKREVLR